MMDYEKLKEVIQQANPEIMELKFGCEVTFGGELHVVIKQPDYYNKNELMTICGQYIRDWEVLPKGKEILGRPIRLADVLFTSAITKAIVSDYLIITDAGAFIIGKALGGFTVPETDIHWNLKDDNLDHQSDETKQFLIDLLVKMN